VRPFIVARQHAEQAPRPFIEVCEHAVGIEE
jgi:hypothetical protein